jgi:hypothetical protein
MSREPISEKTSITIGVLVIVVGGIFWLSSVASETFSNSENLKELKGFIYSELLRINNKLDYIMERLPQK